jgi:hypothetical protein
MSEPTTPETVAELQLRAAQLAARMNVRDTARPTIPGSNTVAATISFKAGSESIRITDPEKFTEWVDQNYPGEIEMVERIRPAFMPRFVNANGVVVGPGGELDIPGIEVSAAGEPTIAVSVGKAAPYVLESLRGLSVRELIEGPDHD